MIVDMLISKLYQCYTQMSAIDISLHSATLFNIMRNQTHIEMDQLEQLRKQLLNRLFKCCICKKYNKGFGNNPSPVRVRGRCCDLCNDTVVLNRRVELFNEIRNKRNNE